MSLNVSAPTELKNVAFFLESLSISFAMKYNSKRSRSFVNYSFLCASNLSTCPNNDDEAMSEFFGSKEWLSDI